MTGLRDHTELDCWKLCEALFDRVSAYLSRPGFDDQPTLKRQLSRSSESPGSNICEGFARYRPRDNAHYVRIARSSLNECLSQLNRAYRLGLISDSEWQESSSLARRARGATTKYILYLERASAPGIDPAPRRRRT